MLICLGRTFFPTNELDYWQFMVFLRGETGCGKSLIIDLMKYFHGGANNIGTITAKFNERFGLAALIKKNIILVDDVPHNLKETLCQETLQMMINGIFQIFVF